MLTFLILACVDAPPGAREPASRASQAKVQTWTVDCAGAADFSDIRSAIDKAHSGDTIIVAPCAYYGSLKLGGKAVHIVGGGATFDEVVVYASPGTSVLKVGDGEGDGTSVENLTLTGGGGTVEVPAIEVSFAALLLKNVHITGNVGDETVYGRSAHLVIQDSVIDDNAPTTGVVIQERRGETLLKDTDVTCGVATTGYQAEHSAAMIDGGRFECKGVRAVEVFHAPSQLQRAVFNGLVYVENEATNTEGTFVKGSVLLEGASVVVSDLTLENVVSTGPVTASSANLVVTASVITGQSCAITAANSNVTTSYDVFWGNTANGCGTGDPTVRDGTSVAVNPLFVDAANGDFHLSAGSPLLDAGPADAPHDDPDGSRSDIGAYGGRHSLGGGW